MDYIGRLTAHLPMATRLLLVKADGSVSIHADDRAYKPLNWMSPPCSLKDELVDGAGTWTVTNKAGEQLIVTIEAVLHDHAHELGVDPGLQKDGVEAELQRLLALHVETFGAGLVAGPPRVPDRDRAGRPAVPGRRPAPSSPWRSSGAGRSTASSSSPATSSCSTAIRCSPRSRACSPRRRSSRRPGCWPPTAASTA